MAKETFVIIGTDTEIGKTHVACHLLRKYADEGKRALGLKPIASGCQQTSDGLRNDDALQLMAASNVGLPYEVVNPFRFVPPIAPHLAAQEDHANLSVATVKAEIINAAETDCDVLVIEGCGGLLVPLNNQETFADLLTALGLPVIMVVGMKLGCINHALLTYHELQRRGISVQGWIANCLDPSMLCLSQNINTLREFIDVPLLEIIAFDYTET